MACIALLLCGVAWGQEQTAVTAVRWWEEHSGNAARGPDVIGYWKFDGDESSFLQDSSSQGHSATLRGAKQNSTGRFGGCLESSAGHPIIDESHGLHITPTPRLSPGGAFTVEMWVKAKGAGEFPETLQPVLLDMKYVSYNHTGFMLSLSRSGTDGSRRLTLALGTGSSSHSWYSEPFELKSGVWRHIAFTYDARGMVTFYVDGDEAGRSIERAAGPMAVAAKPLSIGDRIGSLYNGFPGFIDEVRISKGVKEFRPVRFEPASSRPVFVRMTKAATLKAALHNQTGEPMERCSVSAESKNGGTQQIVIPDLEPGDVHPFEIAIPSDLKPGEYSVRLSLNVPDWGGRTSYHTTTHLPFVITRRSLPHRMPVVMWGIGGTDAVVQELPRLKEIGFTHCLGLGCDYQKVWKDGREALPASAEDIRRGRDMLDTALEHDIGIVASLSPGRWLRTAEVGKPFLRIDRDGKPYGREDIVGLFPRVREFCFNTGAAMGRAYGDHPAFASALLHTEVRGESQVSFHPLEIDTYRNATGSVIPNEVTIKNGVQWQELPEFPADRILVDDDPILQYLTWFWKSGDGWNELNSQLHNGLRQHVSHDAFWTFHDPAVRVPSISGSGGHANVLAHWTYSYPDPIRIGLCTDELFEMARVNGYDQQVMKMTQIIWYRSQTAPQGKVSSDNESPWVDQDPDADYITIAPMHLREAFWWKIARPIQGIMYHGWQSLVATDSPGAYRYTNPNTGPELKRLIRNIVEPLGPSLIQVPDAESDVVFLESFTSQMFARRGTYGWNHTWAGDMYHILMYAQLQPRVLYEESLLSNGLEGAKVLVMADCDVLTEAAVKRIVEFQTDGGLIIADADACPAITPDYVVQRFTRSKLAVKDRSRLLTASADLREWLDPRYKRVIDSSNPSVVTRRRRFNSTDYVFAVNDHREAGTYVGSYGLVMEDGLPSQTEILIKRPRGFVYDLVEGKLIPSKSKDDALLVSLNLGPCQGRLLMVTDVPINKVQITCREQVIRGESVDIDITVTDEKSPIDAVIPMDVRIIDPEGSETEFSGYYGAQQGRLSLRLDVAPNDRPGVWTIMAEELASGKSSIAYLRVRP